MEFGTSNDNPTARHFPLHALVTDMLYQVCSEWEATIKTLPINRKFEEAQIMPPLSAV